MTPRQRLVASLLKTAHPRVSLSLQVPPWIARESLAQRYRWDPQRPIVGSLHPPLGLAIEAVLTGFAAWGFPREHHAIAATLAC